MRRDDWRSRLGDYLAGAARRSFSYGAHDCALFAAGAVQAMTDVDFAEAHRGHYRTELGGLRRLRKEGFQDQFAFVMATFPEVAVAFAQVGDLARVNLDGVSVLGVVIGAHVQVVHPQGLATVGLLEAVQAWRV